MKLYRFRSLGNREDFERAKKILDTGEFWCSRFFELNDPMEGVFTTSKPGRIKKIFTEKNQYVLCSFSSEAFKNPAMWGYYANGFKGIAIEIEVEDNKIVQTGKIEDGRILPIEYNDEVPHIDNGPEKDIVKTILTSKLTCWEHEKEYRFLKQAGPGLYPIGKITGVYFGKPYGVSNRCDICENSHTLRCYECLAKQLKKCAKNKNIECYDVKVKNGKVEYPTKKPSQVGSAIADQ